MYYYLTTFVTSRINTPKLVLCLVCTGSSVVEFLACHVGGPRFDPRSVHFFYEVQGAYKFYNAVGLVEKSDQCKFLAIVLIFKLK